MSDGQSLGLDAGAGTAGLAVSPEPDGADTGTSLGAVGLFGASAEGSTASAAECGVDAGACGADGALERDVWLSGSGVFCA